jgi:hypothetical protein
LIARRAGWWAGIAIMLSISGCAVGNFLTGAPSSRSTRSPQALLQRRCSSCQVVPEPSSMSSLAWQSALERMQRRIRLPQSEWDSLAAMPVREPRGGL